MLFYFFIILFIFATQYICFYLYHNYRLSDLKKNLCNEFLLSSVPRAKLLTFPLVLFFISFSILNAQRSYNYLYSWMNDVLIRSHFAILSFLVFHFSLNHMSILLLLLVHLTGVVIVPVLDSILCFLLFTFTKPLSFHTLIPKLPKQLRWFLFCATKFVVV